jgi:hypothetical protein
MHEGRLIYDEIGSSIHKRHGQYDFCGFKNARGSHSLYIYILKRLKLKGIYKIWYEIMK